MALKQPIQECWSWWLLSTFSVFFPFHRAHWPVPKSRPIWQKLPYKSTLPLTVHAVQRQQQIQKWVMVCKILWIVISYVISWNMVSYEKKLPQNFLWFCRRLIAPATTKSNTLCPSAIFESVHCTAALRSRSERGWKQKNCASMTNSCCRGSPFVLVGALPSLGWCPSAQQPRDTDWPTGWPAPARGPKEAWISSNLHVTFCSSSTTLQLFHFS